MSKTHLVFSKGVLKQKATDDSSSYIVFLMCNSNLIIYNYIYLILRSSGNWWVKQGYFSVSLVPENKPFGFKMCNTGRDVLFTLYHMKSGVLKADFSS